MFHTPAHKQTSPAAMPAQLADAVAGPDFSLANRGSISILQPLTDAGREWIGEHIPSDALTWCGGIVIEHRLVDDIVCGIECDGLEVA